MMVIGLLSACFSCEGDESNGVENGENHNFLIHLTYVSNLIICHQKVQIESVTIPFVVDLSTSQLPFGSFLVFDPFTHPRLCLVYGLSLGQPFSSLVTMGACSMKNIELISKGKADFRGLYFHSRWWVCHWEFPCINYEGTKCTTMMYLDIDICTSHCG